MGVPPQVGRDGRRRVGPPREGLAVAGLYQSGGRRRIIGPPGQGDTEDCAMAFRVGGGWDETTTERSLWPCCGDPPGIV